MSLKRSLNTNTNTLNLQNMAVVKTGAKRKVIYNPKYLFVTPFTGGVKGNTTYQIEDVIKDSTSITQNDNTETKVEKEFSADALINVVQAGDYVFACEIGDMQEDLLEKLCGFKKDAVSGKVYAPAGYTEVFAEIALVFEFDGKYTASIMPKVQLNSKSTMDSFSSNVGRISVNGSGMNLEMTDGSNKYVTPFIVDFDYQLPS